MSYKVKLHHLRAYQAIMLTGSVTAAAERLHTTQPAISRQLAALEAAVGLRLFDRTSGARMLSTPEGLHFFRQVEGTLSGIEDIPEIARDVQKRGRLRLRIGATPPLMNSELVRIALQAFVRGNPNVRLALESRHRLDIEEWVASGQVDLGLALLPVENPYIETLPLILTQVVAVLRHDHPLASAEVLGPRAVRDARLILPRRQPLRAMIDSQVARIGDALTADIEASSALTCCKLAADGFGIAVCDPFSPTAFAHAGLRVLRWEPAVPLSYGILTARGRQQTETALQLISCFTAAAAAWGSQERRGTL